MIRPLLIAVMGMLVCESTNAWPTSIHFQLSWPSNWEHQPAELKNSVWYLQARQRSGQRVDQVLHVRIIDAADKIDRVTTESLRNLVDKLARASRSEVRSFSNASGYYFTASGDDWNHKQRVDGVVLRDAHLIYFSLHTNHSEASSSANMLAALANARIQHSK